MNKKIIKYAKKYNVRICSVDDFKSESEFPLNEFLLFYMDEVLEFGKHYLIRIIKRHDKGVLNAFAKKREIERIGFDNYFKAVIKGIDDKIKGDL